MAKSGERLQATSQAIHDGRGKWMALTAAFFGWMFDGFEIGMFPLVGPSALDDLLSQQIATNPALKDQWFGVIMSVFLVGAATGGVVFGWLGDRIGRVRAMSLSIFTYAIFTGLCGFATEAWHIAVLRFIASLGMGGEWALGVALVTELWPDRSRAVVAGLIGAAANVGMLLVGLLSLVLVSFIDATGEWLLSLGTSRTTRSTCSCSRDGWRLLMIAGALPALLIFFIRLFVPESHKWEAERAKGATSHWATRDLLGVLIGASARLPVIAVWSPFFGAYFNRPAANNGPAEMTALAQVLRLAITGIGLAVALVGYIYPVVRYLGRAETAQQLQIGDARRYIRRMLLGPAWRAFRSWARGARCSGRRNGPARSRNSCPPRAGPIMPRNTRRSHPPAAPSWAPSLPPWSPAGSAAASPMPCSVSGRSPRSSTCIRRTTRTAPSC